jgi:hypothetical protein
MKKGWREIIHSAPEQRSEPSRRDWISFFLLSMLDESEIGSASFFFQCSMKARTVQGKTIYNTGFVMLFERTVAGGILRERVSLRLFK